METGTARHALSAKRGRHAGTRPATEDGLVWYAPHEKPFKLAGFNWFPKDHVYRRLPLNGPLPPAIERLAWCCAGGQVRFTSDTDKLVVKAKLREPFGLDCVPFASPYGPEHMPQTGASGFDLYLGPPGAACFHAVTRFPAGCGEYHCQLLNRTGREPLEFTLNFPLFNGVDEILIGLNPDASVQPPPAYRLENPVVVYGTSITHGGCASRPGSCYTNILSRRLNVPFVNLGFSGSGNGEPEVAKVIASVRDPALFVLDYEANSGLEGLTKTLANFIAILRARHKQTPILVVSKVRFAQEALKSEPEQQRVREKCKAFQKGLIMKLRAAGDTHIHFLDGSTLLGKNYHECSVDGVHPTDHGFFKMADGLHPVLEKLLVG